MSREWFIAGIGAMAAHAWLLFGFHAGTAPVPLPSEETTVDVSLVASAPAPAAEATAAPPAPTPPEPPAEQPPPPPPPVPTPSVPEPAPMIEPKPLREQIAHRETPKPSHPHASPTKAAAPAPPAHTTAAATTGIASSGGASNAVRARYNPKPAYPAEARRLGQQGRVLLEVQVGSDGRAMSVSVKRSSGFPILDSAAEQGVRQWTFEPARIGGLPIASRAEVPVNFSLAQ